MNWFDIIIAIIIITSLIKGYISGLVMQLASLIGLVVGAIFAGQLATIISPYIIKHTEAATYIIEPLSYLTAFILIIVGFYFLGKLITGFLKAIKINTLNKLAGSIFSTAKWLIVVSIFLNLIATMDQHEKIIKKNIREESLTYTYVQSIAPQIIPFLKFDDNYKPFISK